MLERQQEQAFPRLGIRKRHAAGKARFGVRDDPAHGARLEFFIG
jgi:hypothetical protein